MKRFVAMGLSIMGLFVVSAAQADVLWAYDNLAENNRGGVGDALIRFDTATPGTVTEIGRSGRAATLMGGLDFTPDGKLWAYGQAGTTGLYSVNTTTGAATRIGTGSGLIGGDTINDLSYNRVDGKLYGIGDAVQDTTLRLYSINLTTGNATLEKTLTGPSTLDVGLSTDSTGQQYVHDIVTDRMYKITGTNLVAMSAVEGFDGNFSQGMTIDWSRNNNWWHGALNAATLRTELWKVNLTTGAGTFSGNIGGVNGGTGLPEYETGDVAILPVPEPATLTLLALGGLFAARRR